ncbi:MAG: glucosamine inositolphosphorylceramide transferase family protein [Janthinobacterium lividum]
MGLRKDIWRPAIVAAPAADIVARGSLDGLPVHWLPPMPPFRFLADPFGLWRDGRLNVFVETYDYRDRTGAIEVLVHDAALALVERQIVLREPWHLSYPVVFEADGATWLLPEAHRSGRLTLYRAVEFPWRWTPAAVIALDAVAVDATPLWHDGRWWLFYAPGGAGDDRQGALHVAFADRLDGRWWPHPGNPVRTGRADSRPGGTAMIVDGAVVLPVQDCSRTYGGAIRALRFDRLDPGRIEARAGPAIVAPPGFAPFVEGLHTLSAAGAVTLVDAKRTIFSARGIAIELRREAAKLLRTRGAPDGVTRVPRA